MANYRDASSSDTLERSNLSSLQTDLCSPTKKTLDQSSSNTNLNKKPNCRCEEYTLTTEKSVPDVTVSSYSETATYHRQCRCQKLQTREFQQQTDVCKGSTKDRWKRFNGKWPRHCYTNKKEKLYEVKPKKKICVCSKEEPGEIPEERITQTDISNSSVMTSPTKRDAKKVTPTKHDMKGILVTPVKHEWRPRDEEMPEKIEIYYFDHGNSAYFHTTDMPPVLATEKYVENVSTAYTRFWAGIFGYIHIGLTFFTTLVLQFVRCILFSLIRPLTVGVIQLVADYFLKPLLSITFNGIIQPILILFYNIATSFRDCCEPLAMTLGFCLKEFAVLFKSCRLVQITHNYEGTNRT